ncbi:succinate--CoA ligase [GDP-forming] subunit beta, mitochondrial [Folsomia candida]|uniref:succinate--CoA ligase [GDP-forming] subunit beta, mitochondrial n=1 Tax=Folsomia candida TaxID=158441 RepID=UPI000B8FABF4|nr:succinate--CoA ligase [GDP-forming] subunit beta, mitochondrial [Folsomia candida]XP_021954532.1 succinate--CoA ligase [GDP-forming] subunit beta, mitochondrial [Folsomia candida]XP_021954533.1 succinate--CoA ligase [GDP-forming] subunit beta, mitochondrial [Folsomia candida]XP_021954534.1 succinate--CoA ligase [GDP-forming] subunit beta, mitochondrial [Folsomia candida]XP_021954535.1 succinate--CoA ligase [GDP-forming] subunit beta, mitochondrial [Folsomia candida]XP_035708683.1 succinate-
MIGSRNVCRGVTRLLRNRGANLDSTPKRNLNLLEYQSKEILAGAGVAVQKFVVVSDKAQVAKKVDGFKVEEYVVKAQVHAGGRGKGHFDTGFKSGVHILKDKSKIADIAKAMLGNKLITKQTPPGGVPVNHVMIAESVDIFEEKYLCFILDRSQNGPVCIASPAGGMDIEEVAKNTPEKVKTVPIDVMKGISSSTAKEIAQFLEFDASTVDQAASEIVKLYNVFTKYDVTQLEINPLAKTNRGVIAVDAKVLIDDNASFRQKQTFDEASTAEDDPREVEAAKFNLNYIQMEGNIGCLVNGAGLAMATMDIIKLYGGQPANFLDVGGGVSETAVTEAFRIISSDPSVKAILVNVFGGIVNCAIVAKGVVAAVKNVGLTVPLIVRLEGTNVDNAKQILKDSGLKITSAENLDDAAKKAVACLS